MPSLMYDSDGDLDTVNDCTSFEFYEDFLPGLNSEDIDVTADLVYLPPDVDEWENIIIDDKVILIDIFYAWAHQEDILALGNPKARIYHFSGDYSGVTDYMGTWYSWSGTFLVIKESVAEDLMQLEESNPAGIVQISLDTYVGPLTSRNVIGSLPGTTNPEKKLVIGAHYDSVWGFGANDNAAGTATVMEIAQTLAQTARFQSPVTIEFVAFGAEEKGLVGSFTYVFEHIIDEILAGNVIAAINFDVNGYGMSTGLRIGCHARWPGHYDPVFDEYMKEVAHSIDYDFATWTGGGYSDDFPFIIAEVPATCIVWVDEAEWVGPLHSTGDTKETVEPEYLGICAEVTAAGAMRLANAGEFPPPNGEE